MRIGVLRFSSMGDIVLTAPALRGLRNTYPDAEIVFITHPLFADLAAMLPGVDRVEEIRKEAGEFTEDSGRLKAIEWDRIADLQASPRSAKLRKILNVAECLVDSPPRFRRTLMVATRLKIGRFDPVPIRQLRTLAAWGVEDDGKGLELHIPESVSKRVEERWHELSYQPFIFVPGTAHATKCWHGRYWAELFELLQEHKPVMVIGKTGDIPFELAEIASNGNETFFDLTGKSTMTETAAILSKASVVICGDTGPMHLTTAVGTPLVALFGPTVREFGFFPFRAGKTKILERKFWCRPCSAHGANRCWLLHHGCMEDITPKEVADETWLLWDESRKKDMRKSLP